MTKDRLYIFDTTLRDGAQTQGVDFSAEDKRTITIALDKLGIEYIEGGWPGANPTDTEFFSNPPKLENAKLVAFGMTKGAGKSASNDPILAPVLQSVSDAACLVGKTWDYHVDVALGVPREDNLQAISESMAAVRQASKEAMFDAEHFFDGYKANPEYALACLKAAVDGGARWVVLCDTNGGTLPSEVDRIVKHALTVVPADRLGIHAHNDTENAVANTLMAVQAGARQLQGTLNGLGERCGNANLISVLPSLMLKDEFSGFDTGLSDDALHQLTRTSRLLDELLNRAPNRHQAYVGENAFAHKGGLHASAVLKDPRTYEHIPPEKVGNQRKVLVSNQAGRSNILSRFADIGVEIDPKDPRVSRLLEDVKQREFEGFSYDGAEASFELLARRALGQLKDYFEIEKFRTTVERRYNAVGNLTTATEATVKVRVDGKDMMTVAESDSGPVNALDIAMRKSLLEFFPELATVSLVDFKVRILTGGTEAVTRVLIESGDETDGSRWFTVGVSPNIVEASFLALYDAVTYKLFKHRSAKTGG